MAKIPDGIFNNENVGDDGLTDYQRNMLNQMRNSLGGDINPLSGSGLSEDINAWRDAVNETNGHMGDAIAYMMASGHFDNQNPGRLGGYQQQSGRANRGAADIFVVTDDHSVYHSVFDRLQRTNRNIRFRHIYRPDMLHGLDRNSIIWLYNREGWNERFEMHIDPIVYPRFELILEIEEIQDSIIDLHGMVERIKNDRIRRHEEYRRRFMNNSPFMGYFPNGENDPLATPDFLRPNNDRRGYQAQEPPRANRPLEFGQNSPFRRPDFSNLRRKPHNEDAHQAYEEYIRLRKEGKLKSKDILDRICKVYDLTKEEILSHEKCDNKGEAMIVSTNNPVTHIDVNMSFGADILMRDENGNIIGFGDLKI